MRRLQYWLLAVGCLLLAVGCARMGSPDGGWYDDDPPVVIGSIPADKATGVKTKKVTIYFDEYIKLADATQNVIVSPPQIEMPDIQAKGKKIVVELKDTLKPNMTYTIDFSDAISDNNEDNPMGNYTFTFSTGEQTDTLEVSGSVLSAENLDPVAGILVGLYSDLADSAFKTKPLLRVARTDANGHFVIKGVAEGEYRIYALQDADGNYMFTQKSEMIAFSHETYKPYVKPDMRQDTIWRDTLHIDSIAQVHYMHYYPDNIVLTAFQELQTNRYLLKTERNNVLKNLFFNFDSAAGIDYTVDVTKPEGQKINILKMSNGQPFEADKWYKVAINSYRGSGGGGLLTKGAGIAKDEIPSRITYRSELDQRHYLTEEIRKQGTVNPKPNNNWRFIPENSVS